jgi:adenylosuccinate synthase
MVLCEELEGLGKRGIDVSGLRISGAAQVVMPYHRLLDRLEEAKRGSVAIGTTARGIGPAYADKARRTGIRVWDLIDESRLRSCLDLALPQVNTLLEHLYGESPITADGVVEELRPFVAEVRSRVVDGRQVVLEAFDRGEEILFEGAQATFLDIDYGTYPFVTSSHPVAGGACLGTGLGPLDLDNVVGVAKAYTTRVGAGPFPAEAPESEAAILRQAGHEYGTTTGRPRRCGWFDVPVVRTAARLNSVSCLVMSKLDVLDGFESIKVVTGYELDGEMLEYVPSDPVAYARCRPVIEEYAGWCRPIGAARQPEDLPSEALDYIETIAELVDAEIAAVSVGPERDQIVWLAEFEDEGE